MMRRRRRRGHRPHSWAGFAPEEVEDARRAAPDVDLSEWARVAGLAFHGSFLVPAVRAVTPRFPQHVFNASVGLVGPHRVGVVAHELMPIGFSTSVNGGAHVSGLRGDFHGERFRDPRGWSTFLPFVGGVIDLFRDTGSWPFPPHELVAPSTTVSLLVPEAAVVPGFHVGTAERLASRLPRLTDDGLHGFRIQVGDEMDAELRARVLRGPVGRALASIDAPYVELRLHHGQLRVRRSGYARPGRDLEAFVAASLAVADGLASALVTPSAAAFSDPLPDAAPVRPLPRDRGLKLGPVRISRGLRPDEREGIDPDGWGMAFVDAARSHGLANEDAAAFAALHPRVPVPGRVRGVLRGTLPGGLDGRLTVSLQRSHEAVGRAAVHVVAPAGVRDTGPLGLPDPASGLTVTVVDGVVTCWDPELRGRPIDVEGIAVRAAGAVGRLPPGD